MDAAPAAASVRRDCGTRVGVGHWGPRKARWWLLQTGSGHRPGDEMSGLPAGIRALAHRTPFIDVVPVMRKRREAPFAPLHGMYAGQNVEDAELRKKYDGYSSMRKNLLLLACSTLFALLLLEAAIGVATKTGLFPIKVPTYSAALVRSPLFWHDMNPDFGVWHNPNVVNRHTKSCFDVTYRSNSYGARDVERAVNSDRRRFVVLGDSMIEGFGVSDAQRVTNVLERETGIEHLNFGTSGNFGTTQYYLLYKTLASKFTHSAVIVGLLPDNDFRDNDYEFGKQVYPDRYRPYFVGEYPNYRLVYHQTSIEQSTFRDRQSWLGLGKRILSEFTYSYNALAYFKLLVEMRLNPDIGKSQSHDPTRPYSGYYEYRKDQLDLLKYTLEQIKQVAAGRDVIIVLLPTQADFKRYDPSATPPLSAELEKFTAAKGMKFVDLLPDMVRHTKDWNSYVLQCDQHWTAEGHAVAAHYLRAKLTSLYRGPTR
jgi:lysophospholipase L1-like esterase